MVAEIRHIKNEINMSIFQFHEAEPDPDETDRNETEMLCYASTC